MQTVVWMAYSNSTHFSDTNSYKILFISSYGSKDMNLTRFAYLQGFSENGGRVETFYTEKDTSASG
jgi:hypothetical protein